MNDHVGLIKLYQALRSTVVVLHRQRFIADLLSEANLSIAVEKLPNALATKWAMEVRGTKVLENRTWSTWTDGSQNRWNAGNNSYAGRQARRKPSRKKETKDQIYQECRHYLPKLKKVLLVKMALILVQIHTSPPPLFATKATIYTGATNSLRCR